MHIDDTYKALLRDVLDNGELVENGRTKESYLSVFGRQIRVNLRDGFPLLTTKKVSFRLIATELLWILSGSTNVKVLQDQNNHIWDEWATKDQTAKFGRDEGDLGPVYGHQWRNFGATPKVLWKKDYRTTAYPSHHIKDGIDQIASVIAQIRATPNSRRLIVSAWSPKECSHVALPPCHTMFQFKVSHNGTRLNCQLYQRSGDAFLGVPFNIASYALLTHMIAQVTGLEVGEFVHTFGDLHIYTNHIDKVNLQLSREPMPLGNLWLNPNITSIDKFRLEDIRLDNYTSHPGIKADVAV